MLMLEELYKNFIENVICISEKYLFEGKFDEAINLFDSIKNLFHLDELSKSDKARFLIQFAKIMADQKFLKEFNYDNEIHMLMEAVRLVECTHAKNILADSFDQIGYCIYRKGILEGNFEEALNYYRKALIIRCKIDDKLGLTQSYFHLGLYYENKKDSDENDKQKAFQYYQKGLKLAIEGNYKLEQSYFYRHLAFIYQSIQDDFDTALKYHKKSAELREDIGFKFSLQFSYYAIGVVYYMKKDYEKSLEYFIKAYSAAKDMNRIEPLRLLIFRNGQVFERDFNSDTVLKYYNIILAAAVNINDSEGIKEIELKIRNITYRE
ncbi:MAG: tetratricopeptide repeat protein [Candidatus Hermodarchaeota archaeon]